MTNKDRQRAIRARMAQTGEPYSVAARHLREQRATAPLGVAAQAHAGSSTAADAVGADDQISTEELIAFRERILGGQQPETEAPRPRSRADACPVCGDPDCQGLACPQGQRAAQIAARLDPDSLAKAWREAALDVAVQGAAGDIDAAILSAICEAIAGADLKQVRLGPAQIGQLRVAAGPPLDATEVGTLTGLPVAALARAVSPRLEATLSGQVEDDLEDGAVEDRTSDVMRGRWFTREGAGT
jgi:hypothetical protein